MPSSTLAMPGRRVPRWPRCAASGPPGWSSPASFVIAFWSGTLRGTRGVAGLYCPSILRAITQGIQAHGTGVNIIKQWTRPSSTRRRRQKPQPPATVLRCARPAIAFSTGHHRKLAGRRRPAANQRRGFGGRRLPELPSRARRTLRAPGLAIKLHRTGHRLFLLRRPTALAWGLVCPCQSFEC